MVNAIKSYTLSIVGPENVGKKSLISKFDTSKDGHSLTIEGKEFRIESILSLPREEGGKYSENASKVINQVRKSDIVIMMAEITEDYKIIAERFHSLMLAPRQKAIILINKLDLMDNTCSAYDIEEAVSTLTGRTPTVVFSTEKEVRVDKVKEALIKTIE